MMKRNSDTSSSSVEDTHCNMRDNFGVFSKGHESYYHHILAGVGEAYELRGNISCHLEPGWRSLVLQLPTNPSLHVILRIFTVLSSLGTFGFLTAWPLPKMKSFSWWHWFHWQVFNSIHWKSCLSWSNLGSHIELVPKSPIACSIYLD